MPVELFGDDNADNAALVNASVERVWQMSSYGRMYTNLAMKLVDGRTVIIRTDRMLLQVDDYDRARERSRSPTTPVPVQDKSK